MKTLARFACALLVAVQALHAGASPSFSEAAVGSQLYSAPIFSTATPTLASVESDSVLNLRLAPLGSVSSFLVVGPNGSATIDLGGVSSFSFLWGSPDLFNSLSIATSTGIETFSGLDFQSMFGLAANGSNANTRVFSIFAGAGQLLDGVTFDSSGIAFELAVVSPLAEPQAHALMLAGLLIVIYLGWRAGSRD